MGNLATLLTLVAQGGSIEGSWKAAGYDSREAAALALLEHARSMPGGTKRETASGGRARKNALIVYVDGASRGNPGPAAVGVAAYTADGDELYSRGKRIGRATNNVAEYRAVLEGLAVARERVHRVGRSADGLEDVGARLQGPPDGRRHRRVAAVGGPVPDAHEAAGVAERERPQEGFPHHGEDGRGRPGAHGQGCDDHQGVAGRVEQEARGVAQVAREVGGGDHRDRSEPRGVPAGHRAANAGRCARCRRYCRRRARRMSVRGKAASHRRTTAQARPTTLATIAVSSPGSTGFGTCMLYPAASARLRSSGRPYAVRATAGVRPPSLAGRARTLRMSE